MKENDYSILLVEDEENDAMLLKMAFKRNNVQNPIQWVRDGSEAVAYLNGEGAYADREKHPFPEVLILDLKMPRMTGLELLSWIQERPALRIIPTIVMTSSRQDPDIQKAYEMGANTYMIKPSSFDELIDLTARIHAYWQLAIKPAPPR
ncbi:MAG TPA: response regulator [Desulfuromonadaceae bacterium]|nr:response regulator [Desulfuromonadaceae bacterium]